MEVKNQRKKIFANILFLLIVIVVIGIVIFNLNDIQELLTIAKNVNLSYIAIAVLFLILHLFVINLSMYVIQQSLENNLPFFLAMNISNTEHLFNAITPFSSGGQPFQAYFLMKNGLKGDESASLLVANFTIYQFVLTVFSTIGLGFYYKRVSGAINQYALIITIGYIINTVILVGLILISTVKSFEKLLKRFFIFLGKIKFLKKPMDSLVDKTSDFVQSFQAGTKHLLTNKKVLIKSIFLKIIDLFILNSIPIFIFLALSVNIESQDILFIIMMTGFASTFMMWVPTPGATGGVEWAFTMLFSGLVTTSSVLVTGMLFWRAITYFLALILGFISYLLVRKGRK